MAQLPHIGGEIFAVPPGSADQESPSGQMLCRQREKFLHTRFPIGQAVTQKGEIARKTWFRCHGMVGIGIKRVIDGHTTLRTKRAISRHHRRTRSEEHTSELQSLMRISYAVFCLKKKTKKPKHTKEHTHTNTTY